MAYGLLLIRLVFGLTLAAHGSQKLFGWFGGGGPRGTAGMFEKLGFRQPMAMAVLAGLAELGGGLLLALGLLTPLGAFALVVVMLMAIATVHWEKGFWSTAGGYEFNLAIIAAAVVSPQRAPGASARQRGGLGRRPVGRVVGGRRPRRGRDRVARHPRRRAYPYASRRQGDPQPLTHTSERGRVGPWIDASAPAPRRSSPPRDPRVATAHARPGHRRAGVLVAALLARYGFGPYTLPSIDDFLTRLAPVLGNWTYPLVGLLAYLESAAFVGLVVPGELTVVLGGAIARDGAISIVLLFVIVWLAAAAGDSTGFLLGRKLGRDFLSSTGRASTSRRRSSRASRRSSTRTAARRSSSAASSAWRGRSRRSWREARTSRFAVS